MLNTREIDILYFLDEKETPQSIRAIADFFCIGERSIRYHIDNINLYLGKEAIQMKKGECTLQYKDEIFSTINKENILLYSTDLKKKSLYYQIVFQNEVNLTTMSEQLEISRSSIKLYFDEIKAILSPYALKLQQEHKRGFILLGEENNIRKLQLQTLIEYAKLNPTEQKALATFFAEYLDPHSKQTIERYITLIQSQLNTRLTDQSYGIVSSYLQIMIQRIRKKHYILSCDNDHFLHDCNEYFVMKEQLPLLELSCSIQVSEEELLSLVDLFIGSHYSSDTNLKTNNWFEYELLVSKLINMFSELYPINLHQDFLLYKSLLTHLKPTLYRLLNGIKMNEIDHLNVMAQFPKEYEITKAVLNKLHFFTNVQIDSDEIALLTLHFKAAVNRHQSYFSQEANILIVCSHGYGTSQLLKQQLLDTYDVHVIDCIPAHYLTNFNDFSQVDLIITTIPDLASDQAIPIIMVNPILNDQDYALLDNTLLAKQKNKIHLSKLLEVINDYCLVKNEKLLADKLLTNFSTNLIDDSDVLNYSLLHLLPPQNIKLNVAVTSWQEAIQYGGDLLVNSNFANESYTNNLLQSFENYGYYMIIDEGVAIPHSKNEGDVMQTGMSLTILKNPVLFHNDKSLSVFFTFCSKDNHEHIDALVCIANLIKESNFKEEIPNFKHEEDVYHYIYNFVAKQNKK